MNPLNSATERSAQPQVTIRDLQGTPVAYEVLSSAVGHALALARKPLDSLSLVLVEAGRIERLNEQFLGHSDSTDVLAFPAEENEEGRGGEVILCVPVALDQAREHGHSLARELALLAAHGVLHTLGYRDDTEAGRTEMAALQERAADLALAEIGA